MLTPQEDSGRSSRGSQVSECLRECRPRVSGACYKEQHPPTRRAPFEDPSHVLIGLRYGRLTGPRSGAPPFPSRWTLCYRTSSRRWLKGARATSDANIQAKKHLARGVMKGRKIKANNDILRSSRS